MTDKVAGPGRSALSEGLGATTVSRVLMTVNAAEPERELLRTSHTKTSAAEVRMEAIH